jgi:hypothetical protein
MQSLQQQLPAAAVINQSVDSDCFTDMAQMSAALKAQSKEYSKSAEKLYRSAVFQKYLPVIVIVGIILLVLLFRWLYSK